MNQSNDNDDNIVDFRKKRAAKRSGAMSGKQTYKKPPASKVWMAIQLAVFLALVAYLMKSCQ